MGKGFVFSPTQPIRPSSFGEKKTFSVLKNLWENIFHFGLRNMTPMLVITTSLSSVLSICGTERCDNAFGFLM